MWATILRPLTTGPSLLRAVTKGELGEAGIWFLLPVLLRDIQVMAVTNMAVAVVAVLILNLMDQLLLTSSPTTQMEGKVFTAPPPSNTTTNLLTITTNNNINIKLMKVREPCESTCLVTIVSTANNNNNSRDIYTCNNKLISTLPPAIQTIQNQFTQNHRPCMAATRYR